MPDLAHPEARARGDRARGDCVYPSRGSPPVRCCLRNRADARAQTRRSGKMSAKKFLMVEHNERDDARSREPRSAPWSLATEEAGDHRMAFDGARRAELPAAGKATCSKQRRRSLAARGARPAKDRRRTEEERIKAMSTAPKLWFRDRATCDHIAPMTREGHCPMMCGAFDPRGERRRAHELKTLSGLASFNEDHSAGCACLVCSESSGPKGTGYGLDRGAKTGGAKPRAPKRAGNDPFGPVKR